MKTQLWMLLLAIAGCLATTSRGQAPVITSFHGNGQLSWTNSLNSNALYRAEWAAQADGPWYRGLDNIGSIDGLNETGFTVAVPMFYRVVMATNQPSLGMAWIETGDVVLGEVYEELCDDEPIPPDIRTNFVSGFWIDRQEVRIEQWREVFDWAITNGYVFEHPGSGYTNGHPVEGVSWYDCVKWCNARSAREGISPCYYLDVFYQTVYTQGTFDLSADMVDWDADGYRLPTQAEWEKAARGGRTRRLFPWGGQEITHALANYVSLSNSCSLFDTSPTRGAHPLFASHSSPAGYFPPNAYGLYDVSGNVWERCWDWCGAYSLSYQVDPQGPTTGLQRAIRGGSYNSAGLDLSCIGVACGLEPGEAGVAVGFRCVRRD